MAFLVRTKKRHFSTWWQSYGIVATSDVEKAPKCGIKRYFWILQWLGDKLVELVIFRHYFTLLDNQKWLTTRVIAAFSLKICTTCKFGINICDNISNWCDHSLVCHQMVHTLQSLTCKSLASKLARPLCYAIKRAICYTLCQTFNCCNIRLMCHSQPNDVSTNPLQSLGNGIERQFHSNKYKLFERHRNNFTQISTNY
jgi:hypothetical protein